MSVYTYRTPSGYTARMYGEASLSIVNPDGAEIFRTSHRECEGPSGLRKFVDEYLKKRGANERLSTR